MQGIHVGHEERGRRPLSCHFASPSICQAFIFSLQLLQQISAVIQPVNYSLNILYIQYVTFFLLSVCHVKHVCSHQVKLLVCITSLGNKILINSRHKCRSLPSQYLCHFNWNPPHLWVLCSDSGVRGGIPGVSSHWDSVHRADARRWFLRGLLSLLWQLWWEDVPEADILHQLPQEESLLHCVCDHNHHLVSTSVCVYCVYFDQHVVIFIQTNG